jgi:CRP-like cAMP-binding protein
MTKEIELLKKTVTAIYPIPEGEMNLFLEPWKLTTIGRKQTITVAEQKENYLYFITEGVQRIFYVDEQGQEATILLFTYSPSFGGVVDSFLLQQPSRYYNESLTASAYLQISYNQLNNLMLKSNAVEAFVRKALSHSLSGLLERIVDLQCYSSEEKFRKLLQRSPHILQLVPQKYLASYLGIDATNFSKLMNSVRI